MECGPVLTDTLGMFRDTGIFKNKNDIIIKLGKIIDMSANLENPAVATGMEKVSFHSNPKERQCQRMFKLLHDALISHSSKVMLKILQARLQQYVNWELPHIQAGFREGRGTRDQIATSAGSKKKQDNYRKTFISALLTMPKPLTVWITTNYGKFFKRW